MRKSGNHDNFLHKVAWPSGKAGACKVPIPSSNLGATFFFMLYLIATPIGNIKDITVRALETIELCDYLLVEDSRRTGILLNHFSLKVPMKSFHKFNEKKLEEQIIHDLKEGKNIALLSDAGMPTVNDPGALLIARCQKEEVAFTCCPGPCSVTTALALSGFTVDRFEFVGFLPKKPGKRKKALAAMCSYPGASIAFESPHRIEKTLQVLAEIAPDSPVVLARELTKKFETITSGTAQEIYSSLKEHSVKGEYVLIISS